MDVLYSILEYVQNVSVHKSLNERLRTRCYRKVIDYSVNQDTLTA